MDWMITLTMCISLRVPKIEDGNNFGVNVQQLVKEYIASIRTSTLDCMKSGANFHHDRAKRLSKCVKYPGVEDYTHSMIRSDEQHFANSLRITQDLRHNLLWIHDLCVKNWAKLVDPRGSGD